MRNVSRSALVLHSASDMFALVDDVESYPRFLPWCSGAVVHLREPELVEASIELRRGGIRKAFRTRNTIRRNESIDIALLGGAFRHLSGGWQFRQLGELGSKVSLEMEFEFENRMTDMAFGRYFSEICASLVDAFTQRADDIHGR